MNDKLLLAYDPADINTAKEVLEAISKEGFDISLSAGETNPSLLTVVLLSTNTTKEGLYAHEKWIEEQFAYSSYKGFRVMPFLAWHSSKVDFEQLWDSRIEAIYEGTFSEEFKPYGWDLDDENAGKEFHRVYEEYSE